MMKKQVVGAVVAGTLALCAALPSQAMARGGWRRLAGSSAYDTMEAVVQADGLFTIESVDSVVVATGDGYWDALAASGLAGRLDAPVLITPSESLAPQTRAEIERLRPSTIFVAGGPSSVSEAVVSELAYLCGSVHRVSGETAEDTATALFQVGEDWSDTAFVVSSTGYWDALSVAPFAYRMGAPVFLTGFDGRLGDVTLEALAAGGFEDVVIAGGPFSVSEGVEGQLATIGIAATRLKGEDAVGTSAAVATWSLSRGLSADDVFVASTSGYWDALTGAALAGKTGSVLVLCDPMGGTGAYDAVQEAVGGTLETGTVLGGSQSVSHANYDYFRGAIDYRTMLDDYRTRYENLNTEFSSDPAFRGNMQEMAVAASTYNTRYADLLNELYSFVLVIPGADVARLEGEQAAWQADLDAALTSREEEMAANPYSGNSYALNRSGDFLSSAKPRIEELLAYGYEVAPMS